MGRVAVKHFADGPEATLGEMGREAREQAQGVVCVLIDAMVGEGEGTQEPGPYCALVIGGGSLIGAALIRADILRITWGKSAQADGGQKFAGAHIDDGASAARIEELR